MNLVVGATGIVGGEICRQLLAEGTPVRALVRATSDAQKVERLRGLGAELAQGDLRDRPSLDAACRGTTAVLSTASAMPVSLAPGNTLRTVDLDGQLDLVDAARAAEVKHFTFVSATMLSPDTFHKAAKLAVEEHLKASGIVYTILRPGFNMETWLSPQFTLDYTGAKATIFGAGQNRINWISVADVARFAVLSLGHPALRDATVELGGPEALSPLEVVEIFEATIGRPFEVTHVPEAALLAQREALRHDPSANDMARIFPEFGLFYAGGAAIDMAETLRAVPVSLTTVREYAQRVTSAADVR